MFVIMFMFQSFTSAFIRFLEAESQPRTQIKIPLDEMTRRNSKVPREMVKFMMANFTSHL